MRHNYSYIAILEAFQSPSELENYRRKLGLQNAKSSYSTKIWIFWADNWEEEGSSDTTQQLIMKFKLKGTQDIFVVMAVYMMCSAIERLKLWKDMRDMAMQNIPGMIQRSVGDYQCQMET
ncbi:hypothetical protein KY285_028648 [Solanum tuberosum]|nr:hypothetical protein KY289_028790 [Solanum tuberosum]KAH0663664.1 hypothetical protein KY284_028595 [Solanum tuberosum]KAH0667442.1 hypothetical protein KY285_028648 [Solanum tuberosum]